MSLIWNDNEKELLEAIRPVLSTREICNVFKLMGVDKSLVSVHKQAKKMGIQFKDFGMPALHGLKEEERLAIQTVLKERKDHLSTAFILPPTHSTKPVPQKIKKETTFKLIDELNAIRAEIPKRILIEKLSRGNGKTSLVLLLSDWHWGQIIKDNEANIEIYNTAVAKKRIESIPIQILRHFTLEYIKKEFDELVILLGGDMVTGEGIFLHQEMEIYEHAANQVLKVTRALWNLITSLSEIFPSVRIVTTRGNHGRTSASPESNWDNMVYQQLELLVDMSPPDSNIIIKNRYGEYNTAEIKGWKLLLRHHAPVQADTAAGIAKFGGWNGIHNWDIFCFGHFHHWGVMTWNGKPILRNGALAGGDGFAETLAKYDDPVQLCFGVSEEEICKFIKPIYF